MFSEWLYHSGCKKEYLKFSSEILLPWPSCHTDKDEVFFHLGNTCWESFLLVVCEQTCLIASQVFWHSQDHLFPHLRSHLCNVTISWEKKNSRPERQWKSLWLIPGSGRYQDALPWLCAPGFSESAQGGRGGSWCWALCLAISHTQVPPWQNTEQWLWSSSFEVFSRF